MSICVCVCVRVCVRACLHVCEVHVFMPVCTYIRMLMLLVVVVGVCDDDRLSCVSDERAAQALQ